MKTYTELSKWKSFEERFAYLRKLAVIGNTTFGGRRLLNQQFYMSKEWKMSRAQVISRDRGCDLAIPELVILDMIVVHHINPVTIKQVENFDPCLLDPEYLICCSKKTHNQLHYGPSSYYPPSHTNRQAGDTKLW